MHSRLHPRVTVVVRVGSNRLGDKSIRAVVVPFPCRADNRASDKFRLFACLIRPSVPRQRAHAYRRVVAGIPSPLLSPAHTKRPDIILIPPVPMPISGTARGAHGVSGASD